MTKLYDHTDFGKAMDIVLIVVIVFSLLAAFTSCRQQKQIAYTVSAYRAILDTTGVNDVWGFRPLWTRSTTQVLKDKEIIVTVKPVKP